MSQAKANGDERIFVSEGSGSDQIYVDARDLAQEDQSLQEYQAQLAQRGIEALAEKVKWILSNLLFLLARNTNIKKITTLGTLLQFKCLLGIKHRILELQKWRKYGKEVSILFTLRLVIRFQKN